MIFDVKLKFDGFIKETFKDKPEVLNALLKHERKELCVNNLCEQILKAENGNVQFDLSKYNLMIKTVTDLFAHACLKNWEFKALSRNEIKRLETEANDMKNTEDFLIDLEKEDKNERIKIYQSN